MNIKPILKTKEIKIGNNTITMFEASEIKNIYEAMLTAEYILENYDCVKDIENAYDIALEVRDRMNCDESNEAYYIDDVIKERIKNGEIK